MFCVDDCETNGLFFSACSSYFSRQYIEALYLNHPTHSQYIDRDVLEKYYPVGGVRIEDDILVTKDGYENLTTAPKGEEAFRIIDEGE